VAEQYNKVKVDGFDVVKLGDCSTGVFAKVFGLPCKHEMILTGTSCIKAARHSLLFLQYLRKLLSLSLK
jgi:hypothetical protein